MKIKGAQVLLECLKEQGVDTIFGYPGGAVLPIYDALYNTKEITHILTAHEQGATHAADGYARSTGKVGVVIATSGPGATNTVTGIATAYGDSVPLVVFTGQVPQSLIGRDSFQEVDIVQITKSITKKNYIVTDPKELIPTIREAFKIAMTGRPGPVLVDLPKDIQVAEIDYNYEDLKESEAAMGNLEYIKEYEENINDAVKYINESCKPVVYVGGGVIKSNASEQLRKFVEKINAPACCSLMGMGAFPGDHENYTGMIGMHGTKCSNLAVTNCDVLIAVGARFSDRVISKAEAFAPNAKIIHIDIDSKELGKNIDIDVPLKGDVKDVLNALVERVDEKENTSWMEQIKEWQCIKPAEQKSQYSVSPKYVIEKLQELTKENTIITTEVGQNQIWTAQYFKFTQPRTLVTSGGLGTMGFGLGAAIGAAIGNPNAKVINVAGDGSFKMNAHELVTVAKYQIPLVQLVLNNHVLGMVYQWQELFFQGHFSHTQFGDEVDLMKLGNAYGIKTMKITNNEEVEEVLKEALALNKPVIVECDINKKEQVLPIVPPGAPITESIG